MNSTGLLDTSVVIDWSDPDVQAALPAASAISTVTLAELSAGPHLAAGVVEVARRQATLQFIEAMFEPLPLDVAAARSFGPIVAATVALGRRHRGRIADLLIASIAHANRLPLYTRNPDDFDGLDDLVAIVAV
ncbi:MAG: type II toxin-antitoxin system VapC family toxin [Actinobacteria bacterium]|nr:type II toxin-antitoxin system VapC family toxin [Actinomycetota bacterium]